MLKRDKEQNFPSLPAHPAVMAGLGNNISKMDKGQSSSSTERPASSISPGQGNKAKGARLPEWLQQLLKCGNLYTSKETPCNPTRARLLQPPAVAGPSCLVSSSTERVDDLVTSANPCEPLSMHSKEELLSQIWLLLEINFGRGEEIRLLQHGIDPFLPHFDGGLVLAVDKLHIQMEELEEMIHRTLGEAFENEALRELITETGTHLQSLRMASGNLASLCQDLTHILNDVVCMSPEVGIWYALRRRECIVRQCISQESECRLLQEQTRKLVPRLRTGIAVGKEEDRGSKPDTATRWKKRWKKRLDDWMAMITVS